MRLSYFPCQTVKATKVEDWEFHLLRGDFLIDILFEPLNDSEYSLTNPLKRFSHKLHLSLRTTQNGKEWTYLGPWIFVSKQGLYVVIWIQKLTPLSSENFTSKKNIISYMGCMTQLYFFCVVVVFLRSMHWHQWPMTAMWPSATHFCIMLLCLLKCVLVLYLVPTWGHFLVPWLTLDACWDWTSVMQTPSTIIFVTSTLCAGSPAQVPTSKSGTFHCGRY